MVRFSETWAWDGQVICSLRLQILDQTCEELTRTWSFRTKNAANQQWRSTDGVWPRKINHKLHRLLAELHFVHTVNVGWLWNRFSWATWTVKNWSRFVDYARFQTNSPRPSPVEKTSDYSTRYYDSTITTHDEIHPFVLVPMKCPLTIMPAC